MGNEEKVKSKLFNPESLSIELRNIKEIAYDQCSLKFSDFTNEAESIAYNACQFKLNGLHIICRTSKITPKKNGQFVTFWKRNKEGVTMPYEEKDPIDFYIVNVMKNKRIAQFIFSRSILIKKGIISTRKKEGKRGFRIYPIWDTTNNKQAKSTQEWQLNYFVEFNNKTNLNLVNELFYGK